MEGHVAASRAGVGPFASMRLVRGGVPLYRQLTTVIRALARDGSIPDALVTERSLCERFNVSRTTVRQALHELAAEGVVVRLQGKGTTLVPRKPGAPTPVWVFGSLEDMIAYGFETTYALLEQGTAPATQDIADALRLEHRALAYRFLGTRAAGGSPFALLESWLPYQIGVQLAPMLHGNSPIIALIENNLGVHVAEVEQSCTAVAATRAVARHTGVRAGRPTLLIRRLYFEASGAPLALSMNACNPARFHYRVRLRRRGAAGATSWGD
jgi:GntR family transcriptional regulator